MRKIVSILVICLVVCGVLSIGSVYCLPDNESEVIATGTDADTDTAIYDVSDTIGDYTIGYQYPSSDKWTPGCYSYPVKYVYFVKYSWTEKCKPLYGGDPEFEEAFELFKPRLTGEEPIDAGYDQEYWDRWALWDGNGPEPEGERHYLYASDYTISTQGWNEAQIRALANIGYPQDKIDIELEQHGYKEGPHNDDLKDPREKEGTFWDKIVAFFKMIAEFFQGLFN